MLCILRDLLSQNISESCIIWCQIAQPQTYTAGMLVLLIIENEKVQWWGNIHTKLHENLNNGSKLFWAAMILLAYFPIIIRKVG